MLNCLIIWVAKGLIKWNVFCIFEEICGYFMNRSFVVLGIVLLFTGVIVASASTMATETPESSIVKTTTNAWEISGLFGENEKLLVDFTPPNMEQLIIPEPTLKLHVEITGPYESKTVFELEFAQRGFEGATVLWNLTVVLNENGLTVSDSMDEVGGIVPYAGNYSANITTRRWWGPPASLTLHAEVVHKEYPYLFGLAIGMPLAVVGGSLSFYSVRNSKRKLRSRIKRVD
jgi:hypothetical protein